MKFQSVKGTRDFYPEMMRVRNWIADAWRRVSLRNGFEEYDAPIFEYLDLFTAKSGPEIAEQLFSFTDRGGRNLAIRPEITPSLARMVAAKVNSLPRPIKWFSVPRLCRAERPQRGRLREFFQWNVDVIGEPSVLADAECIFVLVDFLREVGLTPDDVQVRIGSRPLAVAAITAAGIGETGIDSALAVLDKRPKVDDGQFEKLCEGAGLSSQQIECICEFQDVEDLAELKKIPSLEKAADGIDDLVQLFEYVEAMGAGDYCRIDLRVVRGLAYYTGIVYEVFGEGESLRAVAGGGRYDRLLEVVGGPKVPATGFGMGDVVLEILLEEKGRLPAELRSRALDFFVIDGEDGIFETVLRVSGALRRAGFEADFSYKRQGVGKQLKTANRLGAAKVAIVRADGVSVKDLSSGKQVERTLEAFLADPRGL